MRSLVNLAPISLPVLALTLIIAGITAFASEQTIWGVVLVSLAVLAVSIILVKLCADILPKPIYSADKVKSAMEDMYALARNRGGHLIATHITPLRLTEKKDLTLSWLANPNELVTWERLVFMEDAAAEEAWIRKTLEQGAENLETQVHYAPSNFLMPPIIWSIFPRLNLLLYNKNSTYISLLGLGTLDTRDEKHRKLNLAVMFKSRRAYSILHRYYEATLATHLIRKASSVDAYPPSRTEKGLDPHYQSILTRMMYLTLSEPDLIWHCGVFGSVGATLLSHYNYALPLQHEADVDLMIVVMPGKKEIVRDRIQSVLKNDNINIVWGDDETYFYEFRDKTRITVDIEIRDKGSDFYKEHPLLGSSIFHNYWPLYTHGNVSLGELLHLPLIMWQRADRFKCLLDD